MEASRRWVRGHWALDLRGDELADIRYDGGIVLRGVQAVVRDQDWNTATLVVDDVRTGDAVLTVHVHSTGLGATFVGTLEVTADDDELTVRLDLVAREPFDTNRTGLVVLLPPTLAGDPAEVRHPDGSREAGAFPVAISPHQPMRDVQGLVWEHDGAITTIALTGDVFEMEDQRNWTDASYKLYSRPLDLPFPYRVDAGRHVLQTVTVTVLTIPDAAAGDAHREAMTRARAESPTRIVLTPTGGRMPGIAIGASTAPDPAPPTADQTTDLLVELDLRMPNWRAALARAAASGRPLDVRVVPDGTPDDLRGTLDDLVDALDGVDVVRIGAYDPASHITDTATAARLRAAVGGRGLPIVGGTRAHFTELNRQQERLAEDLDGLTFSVTPLFHAGSTAQLVESAAMQRLVARQAVQIAAGRPVHIGPVTLRPRFNNVATAPEAAPTRRDLAEGYGAAFTGGDDPRQTAPELATWTIATAAALAVPGVASIAYFEEWGPRGIRSARGEPHPVAAAIEALAGLDGELLVGESLDGLVWALGSRDAVLVANLDDRPRELVIVIGDGIGDTDTDTSARASVLASSWIHLAKPPPSTGTP